MIAVKDKIEKSLFDTHKKAWQELQKALQQEKFDAANAKLEGIKIKTGGNVIAWLRKYWATWVVWLVAVVIIWKALNYKTPSRYRDGRKSHHGINRYGVPY